MKVLLATNIAWMLCTILVILPTLGTPSTPPKEKLEYTKVTWKLDYEPKTYSTFISSLRSAFNSFGKVCDIPVTPKKPEPNDAYILVEIQTERNTITVAFQTSDFYFIGFKDKITDKKGQTVTRANFISRDIDKSKKYLFKDAKITKTLPFGETYGDLVAMAGVKGRENFKLGVASFSSYIDTMYGEDYNSDNVNAKPKPKPKPDPKKDNIKRTMAKFALTAIQMIAEGTRFKYIEGEVKKFGIPDSFYPDGTFTLLENRWERFSKLIHGSSPDCKPVESCEFPWKDIKKKVGLLKYLDTGLGDVIPSMESIFSNNTDADDVASDFI